MALTAEFNKVWPNLQENGLFWVGVEVVLKEDGVEQRRVSFREATTKAADVSTLVSVLAAKAQAMVDTYKTEKQAYNHAKYEALRAGVASAVVL